RNQTAGSFERRRRVGRFPPTKVNCAERERSFHRDRRTYGEQLFFFPRKRSMREVTSRILASTSASALAISSAGAPFSTASSIAFVEGSAVNLWLVFEQRWTISLA